MYFGYILHLNAHIYSSDLKEIDYYAYYLPGKNIVICSDKIKPKGLILNEFEIENGYTCLLNLKKNGLYMLNLHISKLENSNDFDQSLLDSKPINGQHQLIDFSIGKNLIFNNIDTTDEKNISFVRKVLLNKEGSKILIIDNKNCDINKINECKYFEADDVIFMKKFVKLNFHFKMANFSDIVLLEKESLSIYYFF